MECPSSDATVDVFPKLAASAESGEDLDTISVIALTPGTYSTGSLAHGRDDDSLSAVSLVLWTMTPSSKAPAEAAPTKSQRPFSILELGTLQSTRCSSLCLNDGIGVLTPTFQLDVTLSIKHQGQMLRPSPWPSFVAQNTSTAHNGNLEPALSAATASNRDVVPYLTLPPLLSTLKASPTLSSGSGHAGPVGHCEASPYWVYVSRVFTALVPPPVTEIMPENIHHTRVCQGKHVFCPWTENQLKHIGLAPWLSQEIPVEAAVSTKAFSINQDGIQAAGHYHVYKKKLLCMFRELSMGVVSADFHEWLILIKNILVRSLYWLQIMKNLAAAGETCCGIEQLDLMHVHNCMRILVELKPWPSWEVNYCCDTMAFFCWWFLQNAFSSIFSCTTSNMLQLSSHLSNSPSSILIIALQNSSVIWCLKVVFERLQKWWPHTQCVQTTSAIFEAYIQYLDTSAVFNTELNLETEILSTELLSGGYTELNTVEWNFRLVQPAQLDYLLPPAKPPDSSKGYETMLTCDQFTTRGVKGISHAIPSTKLVLNYYRFMVRNEYSTGSTFFDPMRNCDTNLEYLLLKFAGTPEYPCYIMISSQLWLLLMTVHSLMRDQFTYAGDQLLKILGIYVQSHGKVAVLFSCPCSEQSYRLEENVEVLTFLSMIPCNEKEHRKVGKKPRGITRIHTQDIALRVFTDSPFAYKNSRLTVCCTCCAMSKNQDVSCKPTNEEQSDCMLRILFPSSYLGMTSKMRAAFDILPSMVPVTEGMETEGNSMGLSRGSEMLNTYSLKDCKNSPLQLIDTSSLGKIWLVHGLNEQWDPGVAFFSCPMLTLIIHFVRSTIHEGSSLGCQLLYTYKKSQYLFHFCNLLRDEVSLCALLISVACTISSVKRTSDLVRPMDHLNDGQGIQNLEMTTPRENVDCWSVPSVSAQLKCDSTEYHLHHSLNPQIWALQVKHHLVKVGWQKLLLQHHVGGLSPWDLGSVRLLDTLGVVVELQVPWDPGVHYVLGEFVASACGQADSQGEANVMTMAREKPMGQVMTWTGFGTGLGLLEWSGSFIKEATHLYQYKKTQRGADPIDPDRRPWIQ